MHESGEKAVLEIGQVQGGELFTAFKAMFIYGAFVFAEEMAGYPVHDHQAIVPFFNVLLIKVFPGLSQMLGKFIGFWVRDQYHQAFAAIAAGGTTNLQGNGFVQLVHHPVDLLSVPFFDKYPETVVLFLFFC